MAKEKATRAITDRRMPHNGMEKAKCHAGNDGWMDAAVRTTGGKKEGKYVTLHLSHAGRIETAPRHPSNPSPAAPGVES